MVLQSCLESSISQAPHQELKHWQPPHAASFPLSKGDVPSQGWSLVLELTPFEGLYSWLYSQAHHKNRLAPDLSHKLGLSTVPINYFWDRICRHLSLCVIRFAMRGKLTTAVLGRVLIQNPSYLHKPIFVQESESLQLENTFKSMDSNLYRNNQINPTSTRKIFHNLFYSGTEESKERHFPPANCRSGPSEKKQVIRAAEKLLICTI